MLLSSIIAASRRRTESGGGYDADAAVWFAALVSAGSSITDPNKAAVSAFIAGLKSDGTWAALDTLVLLCAADSLAGALVPVLGPTPTSTISAGNYDRVTGLTGQSTKRVASNRLANVSPQDDASGWVHVSGIAAGTGVIQSLFTPSGGGLFQLQLTAADAILASVNATAAFPAGSLTGASGLVGFSRASSANFTFHAFGTDATVTKTSTGRNANGIYVMSRSTVEYLQGNCSAYGFGTAVNLAAINTRLATLMASLT